MSDMKKEFEAAMAKLETLKRNWKAYYSELEKYYTDEGNKALFDEMLKKAQSGNYADDWNNRYYDWAVDTFLTVFQRNDSRLK